MLELSEGTRIFVAVNPVDMRRSFDGSCATIAEALGNSPASGGFVFVPRQARRSDQGDHLGL